MFFWHGITCKISTDFERSLHELPISVLFPGGGGGREHHKGYLHNAMLMKADGA